jgi:UTP--glucose-1-phosphate uridylyltransferase
VLSRLKAVIPAAGLGTRMLPATKEQPKEMLPIFSKTAKNSLCLKPLLQLVFEHLYAFGLREFCFIIRRGKRAIEDYFTPDNNSINVLRQRRKDDVALELCSLYERVDSSKLIWINQAEPKGFGDAVLQAEPFIGAEDFLVHTGDTYIVSDGSHLERLVDSYEKLEADAAFAVKRVKDPRHFGIIRARKLEQNVFRVIEAVEKPAKPPTKIAIILIYIFKSELFDFLRRTKPDKGWEIQLTGGIQGMIDAGLKVIATVLREEELWLDIGTPNSYWEALETSYTLNSHNRERVSNTHLGVM